jgi:trehalose-phosphatase
MREAREQGRGPLGLFLDFDGTLSEIVPLPSDARIREDTARALRQLAHDSELSIAIVSGRSLDDLASQPGLEGLWLVGSHGGEIMAPDGARALLVDPLPARPALEAFLEGALDLGLPVEDKGIAVAAHLRQLDPSTQTTVSARLILQAEHLARAGEVSWIAGNSTIEVRASGATKDRAVRELVSRWPSCALMAVGDGPPDEEMFAEVSRRGGWTAKVGPGPTTASARLSNPAAVACFLRRLADSRGRKGEEG